MLAFLLAVEEGAEGAEEAASNPILPEWSEMLWGAISFALLYVMITYVLLPAAKRVMNDRAATIKADLDAAEAARDQARTAAVEAEDQLAEVRAEAASIIDAARAEAETERERLVGRAEREVTAMRELAASEVAEERAEAMAAVRPQVADLAVDAASKVMNRPITSADAAAIVNRHLDNSN